MFWGAQPSFWVETILIRTQSPTVSSFWTSCLGSTNVSDLILFFQSFQSCCLWWTWYRVFFCFFSTTKLSLTCLLLLGKEITFGKAFQSWPGYLLNLPMCPFWPAAVITGMYPSSSSPTWVTTSPTSSLVLVPIRGWDDLIFNFFPPMSLAELEELWRKGII